MKKTNRITSYNVCYTKLLRDVHASIQQLSQHFLGFGFRPDGTNDFGLFHGLRSPNEKQDLCKTASWGALYRDCLKLITVEISFTVLFLRFFETFHYGTFTLRYWHIPITSRQPFPSLPAFFIEAADILVGDGCLRLLPIPAPFITWSLGWQCVGFVTLLRGLSDT